MNFVDLYSKITPLFVLLVFVFVIFYERKAIGAVNYYLGARRKEDSVSGNLPRNIYEKIELDELDGDLLNSAINDLVEYCRSVKPMWIVGIHTGGRLLSVLVAERLGIPSERCLYLGTQKGIKSGVFLDPAPNDLVTGNVVVVDDISRSGDTIAHVKEYFNRKRYRNEFRFNKIYFATLSVADSEDNYGSAILDWSRFRSANSYLVFPWTERSVESSNSFDRSLMKIGFDENAYEFYWKVRSEFAFSLKTIKSYLRRLPKTN